MRWLMLYWMVTGYSTQHPVAVPPNPQQDVHAYHSRLECDIAGGRKAVADNHVRWTCVQEALHVSR